MYTKFASLQHPAEYGYAFETSPEYSSRSAEVNRHFRMFQTFGDGLTQHSREWAITVEFMADYLASMATAIIAGKFDDDEDRDTHMMQSVSWCFEKPSIENIEFAASVKYKESDKEFSKRRYFSKSERKISAVRSKEYDKRFEEIRSCHDGSPEAIYQILLPEGADMLTRVACASAVYAWVQKQDGIYMSCVTEFLKLTPSHDYDFPLRDIEDAFAAFEALIAAYKLRVEAVRHLLNLKRTQERRAENKAEKAKIAEQILAPEVA
jgi:hypothetical protein